MSYINHCHCNRICYAYVYVQLGCCAVGPGDSSVKEAGSACGIEECVLPDGSGPTNDALFTRSKTFSLNFIISFFTAFILIFNF